MGKNQFTNKFESFSDLAQSTTQLSDIAPTGQEGLGKGDEGKEKISFRQNIEVGKHVFNVGDIINAKPDNLTVVKIKADEKGKNVILGIKNSKGITTTMKLISVVQVKNKTKIIWDVTGLGPIEMKFKNGKGLKKKEETTTTNIVEPSPVIKKETVQPTKKEETGAPVVPSGPKKEEVVTAPVATKISEAKTQPIKTEKKELKLEDLKVGSFIWNHRLKTFFEVMGIPDKTNPYFEFLNLYNIHDERPDIELTIERDVEDLIKDEDIVPATAKEVESWRQKIIQSGKKESNKKKSREGIKPKKTAEREKSGEEKTIEDIAEILKNQPISQIIVHAKENFEPGENKGLTSSPDLDTQGALLLFNEFNNKPIEKIYTNTAVTSFVPKGGSSKNLNEKREGVNMVIDVGGSWLKLEQETGKPITIRIDHHGSKKNKPTSATEMMFKIMDQAKLLKEKPEWLQNFVGLVNKVDNLSYLEDEDRNGKKIFNERYAREQWPNSLYAIAEEIPFDVLVALFEFGEIKDFSKPFTEGELAGELGKMKAGEKTIAELCKQKKDEMSRTLAGLNNAVKYAREKKMEIGNTALGKIIYHNFPKMKDKNGREFVNKVPNKLAFIGAKALGADSVISWNEKRKEFYINSNHPNLPEVVEKLAAMIPGTRAVRGVMVFAPKNPEAAEVLKNLTEKQFLDLIDPNILKNTKKLEEGTGESVSVVEAEFVTDSYDKEHPANMGAMEGYLGDLESFKETKIIIDTSNISREQLDSMIKDLKEKVKELSGEDLAKIKENIDNFSVGDAKTPERVKLILDEGPEKLTRRISLWEDWAKDPARVNLYNTAVNCLAFLSSLTKSS